MLFLTLGSLPLRDVMMPLSSVTPPLAFSILPGELDALISSASAMRAPGRCVLQKLSLRFSLSATALVAAALCCVVSWLDSCSPTTKP